MRSRQQQQGVGPRSSRSYAVMLVLSAVAASLPRLVGCWLVVGREPPTFLLPATTATHSSLRAAAHDRPYRISVSSQTRNHHFKRALSSSSTSSSPSTGDDAQQSLESLRNEVEDALLHRCRVPGGSMILISVSGGSDSMALLHLLNDVKSRWEPRLRLEVVHFNHGLRPEAVDEEALVVVTARRLGLPVHVRRWEEKGGGSGATGIQERAREWRRSESEGILKTQAGEGAGFIATAHHGDDQVETFTMKLLRGAHLSHLRGMEYHHSVYIKPFLGVSKESLRGYLQARQLQWLEDASNAEDKYKRNKVRLRLLPLMQDLAGGQDALKTRVEELSKQSRALESWITNECDKWEEEACSALISGGQLRDDELPLTPWRPLPHLMKEELLHRFVLRVSGGDLSLPYSQVERLMDHLLREGSKDDDKALSNQWQLYIGRGWVAECKGEVLRLVTKGGDGEEGHGREGEQRRQVAEDVTICAPAGWSVRARRHGDCPPGGGGEEEEEEEAWPVTLYNIPPGATLHVRTRVEGDRFWPTWRASPVKMKDFLRGQKVPLHRRDAVPVVVVGQDVVCVYPAYVSTPCAQDDTQLPPLGLAIEGDQLYIHNHSTIEHP